MHAQKTIHTKTSYVSVVRITLLSTRSTIGLFGEAAGTVKLGDEGAGGRRGVGQEHPWGLRPSTFIYILDPNCSLRKQMTAKTVPIKEHHHWIISQYPYITILSFLAFPPPPHLKCTLYP